jgi:hypothetical protein
MTAATPRPSEARNPAFLGERGKISSTCLKNVMLSKSIKKRATESISFVEVIVISGDEAGPVVD